MMRGLSDEAIEALGTIFVSHKIGEKRSITFEQFVIMKIRGDWDLLVT